MNELVLGNKKFKIFKEDEYCKEELESEANFINRISKIYNSATHWLCKEDMPNQNVTQEQLYTFTIDDRDGEYVIIDDTGTMSMIWLVLDGLLLIEIDTVENPI